MFTVDSWRWSCQYQRVHAHSLIPSARVEKFRQLSYRCENSLLVPAFLTGDVVLILTLASCLKHSASTSSLENLLYTPGYISFLLLNCILYACGACVYAEACAKWLEDKFQESLLSFHCVGPRETTLVMRLGSKPPLLTELSYQHGFMSFA